MIAIPRLNSSNSTIVNITSLLAGELPGTIYPTSYEISQQLNMTNLPVDDIYFTSKYINQIDNIFNVTFSGLNDRTVFDFYIATRNDFPKYYYYMLDSEVVKLTIKTTKKVSKIFSLTHTSLSPLSSLPACQSPRASQYLFDS